MLVCPLPPPLFKPPPNNHSLEKEPLRRASPWRMLEHPWMIEMRAKRVNMAHFLATVWGWEEK